MDILNNMTFMTSTASIETKDLQDKCKKSTRMPQGHSAGNEGTPVMANNNLDI